MKSKLLAAALCCLAFTVRAELKLGTPFTDNAVFQRNATIRVWGEAAPGSHVTVTFAGATARAKAGADGAWQAELPACEASKTPREMKVTERTGKTVTGEAVVRNILVGEVWFASGQSNMECPLTGRDPRYRDANGFAMAAMTRNSNIRFANEVRRWNSEPQKYGTAIWFEACPEFFAHCRKNTYEDFSFSAIAYYYALQLYLSLDVPIGVINCSWGGTVIDAWTPRSGYKGHPELQDMADYPVAQDQKDFQRKGVISGMQQQPTVLWNAMVSPWAPFACKGFIWYQGCSNNSEAERYCDKMHALYDGWTREFKNDALKLYFVQLAPYAQSFFKLQLAQSKFAAEEPNAALVTICDVGNMHDIHPNNKFPVAARLALHALKRDYGFSNIIDDSPEVKSWRKEGDKFYVTFSNASSWYVYKPDYTTDVPGFEMAGLKGGFKPAKLQNKVVWNGPVEGAELVFAAEGVTDPLCLRYLGGNERCGCLYSADSGLPVGPFQVGELPDGEAPKAVLGDALKLPELEGFTPVLAVDLPESAPFTKEAYSLDETAKAGEFSRVAYVLELERPDGSVRYSVSIMDAFTKDAAMLGVPCESNMFFRQRVSNFTLRTNALAVDGFDNSDRGAIEFWKCNYRMGRHDGWEAGSDNAFDVNDSPCWDGEYGSMQIHDLETGFTVFAVNDFNTKGVRLDTGIGPNYQGEHSDFTFMGNAGQYKTRRLTILVK